MKYATLVLNKGEILECADCKKSITSIEGIETAVLSITESDIETMEEISDIYCTNCGGKRYGGS